MLERYINNVMKYTNTFTFNFSGKNSYISDAILECFERRSVTSDVHWSGSEER